jgi:hypothetical protein
VTPPTTGVFDLPDRLVAKSDPALIAGDERHFAAVAECLEQSIADLSDRLDAERRAPGGAGQEALDRDLEVHRLTARLRTLRRARGARGRDRLRHQHRRHRRSCARRDEPRPVADP